MMERIKKEEEMRKKKEQEDSLTLEQTKEQVKAGNKGNIPPSLYFLPFCPHCQWVNLRLCKFFFDDS